MKDLGPLSHFLGIHLTPTPSGIFLWQEQYIHDLLDRANMLNCNPCTTPIDTKPKLSSIHGLSVNNATAFRSLVGTLQYLTITRPWYFLCGTADLLVYAWSQGIPFTPS
jgi:hypothetical protein